MPTSLRSRVFLAFAAPAGLSVDSLRENPLVPGVSVITEGPAAGHFKFDENDQPVPVWIDNITLQQVMAVAQEYRSGLRVNMNHWSTVLDAAGRLNNFRLDGQKLRADLTLLPTYEGFDHLTVLIAEMSDTFGLSIDFSGPSEIRDGKAFARCDEIYSADLVPNPAANQGLFSDGNVVRFDSSKTHVTTNSSLTPMPQDPQKLTLEQLASQVQDALQKLEGLETKLSALEGLDAKITELNTKLSAKADSEKFTQLSQKFEGVDPKQLSKVAELETKLSALTEGKVLDIATEAKQGVDEIKTQLSEITEKVGRRMGIEFAARAGASPSGGAPKPGEDNRKAFEIPASEKNTVAVRDLLGAKK